MLITVTMIVKHNDVVLQKYSKVVRGTQTLEDVKCELKRLARLQHPPAAANYKYEGSVKTTEFFNG